MDPQLTCSHPAVLYLPTARHPLGKPLGCLEGLPVVPDLRTTGDPAPRSRTVQTHLRTKPSRNCGFLTHRTHQRVYCPELEAQAQGPPAGEFPYSRKWTFQESHLLTVAGDSRLPWSTLTPSPLTPSSFSLPHSRESTESEHTGMTPVEKTWKQVTVKERRKWCHHLRGSQ